MGFIYGFGDLMKPKVCPNVCKFVKTEKELILYQILCFYLWKGVKKKSH